VERLAHDLPLPQLFVPRLGGASIGPAETDALADALATSVGDLVPEVRAT
jgi:hypothetical protein